MATTAWAVKNASGKIIEETASRFASLSMAKCTEILGELPHDYPCVEVVILEKEEYDKLLSKHK